MIRELVLWRAVDLMESVRRVAEVGWRWGCTPRQECGSPNKLVRAKGWVIVDVVGLGAGLNDRLHQLGYQTIQFNGGEKTLTTGPGGVPFSNRRPPRSGPCAPPWSAHAMPSPDDLLFDELVSLRWRPAPTGKDRAGAEASISPRGSGGAAIGPIASRWRSRRTARTRLAARAETCERWRSPLSEVQHDAGSRGVLHRDSGPPWSS